MDYSEEIYPQINQSLRFPQLSSYFDVEKAWFIHNKTLEDLFSQARKRFQKNPINNIVTGVESSLCTGFLVVNNWNDVEKIASDGLIPGNDPDTWLGQQKLGECLIYSDVFFLNYFVFSTLIFLFSNESLVLVEKICYWLENYWLQFSFHFILIY